MKFDDVDFGKVNREIGNAMHESFEKESVISGVMLEDIRKRNEFRKNRPQLNNNPINIIQQFPSPFEQDEKDIDTLLSLIDKYKEALQEIDEVVNVKERRLEPTSIIIRDITKIALKE